MSIHIGRLQVWLWSGSWNWFERIDCECCGWNLYIGPFGVEWDPS